MKRSVRKRQRIKRTRHAPPGTAPGMISVRQDALKPVIKTFLYDTNSFIERDLNSVEEIAVFLKSEPGKIHWVDIRGFGSQLFMEQVADCFKIHRLQMEDVVNVYQRPKAEDLADHLFLISRVLRESDGMIQDDQLSVFLGGDFVLTIQERYDDLLDPVRERIRSGKGFVRTHSADYLAYVIMDTSLDNLYPIVERLGEKLDDLQEELLSNPTRSALDRVLSIKRELVTLRRTIWRERDKVNDILRSEFPQIHESTKIFFRDSYDHCIQILDLVESCREVTASLMDVYHSSVSFKLNQVMKVLTIISTIFIPLTFIVGVYGMNFAAKDPVTGKALPMNMPELYSPSGYLDVMLVMVAIVVLQLIFFFKKGWLSKG